MNKKRNQERKYLLFLLLIISLGFLLLFSSYVDKGVSATLTTKDGELDISYYFLSLFPNAFYAFFFVAVFLLMHLYIRIKLPDADPLILPAVAMLSGIGLIILLRLSPDLALSRNDAIQAILSRNPEANIKNNVLVLAQLGMKQFLFIVSGILLMILSINIFNIRSFSWLSSKKYFWVFLSTMLIIATLLLGTEINGRSLWLFGFQTVELVKLLMLFFIAGYIYEKGRGIMTYRQTGFNVWINYTGPFIVMWFFAIIPLFIQRDLGPTFLMFVVFLLMFYYAGNRNFVTVSFLMLIMITGYIFYKTGYPPVVHERFEMMFDPFGRSESMSRVLWSISSGSIFGSGIGYGQPHRIPEVQSDFNFTVICEEMGFAGGTVVILAYAVFIHRCFKIASQTENKYKKTLVTGIAVLFGVQSFIIIFGNLGVIPMTGITLPLISYGGSSMLMNFIMAGIVLRISGDKS
jgi:cell division protein FtsW (lipid II flippase)